MPRAFTEIERKSIRSRLIESGKRSINRSGMRALVVDDIAREAGISKGSFYSFFPSREDFILSVFEAWEEEYRSGLLRSVSEGGGSPRERLARFFRGSLEMIEREPGLAKIGWGEIERLIEILPPERLAAHQASDARALGSAMSRWAELGIVSAGDLPALEGVGQLLFAVAIHKDDFRGDGYERAVGLLVEALADRLARPGDGATPAGGEGGKG
jgi:AcrR family transcriptional regulator